MASDIELIERIKKGEKFLYEQIVRKYNQRLYRIAKAIIKEDGEIDDILQDTYLKAFKHLDQFEGRSEFSTWLTKILINQANGSLQRKGKFLNEEENEKIISSRIEFSQNPEQNVMNDELRKILENAIEALPEKYKAVYIMRELEGLSGKETADCLGISEENVRIRQHRAKEILKDVLYKKSKDEIEIFRFGNHRCDKISIAVMFQIERQN